MLAVHDAVAEAVARARAGDGPSIVEGVTMRMHGHAEHDPADYVPKEMYEEWAKKDPVELFENVLIEAGVHRRRHAAAGPGGRRGRPPSTRAAQGARRSDAGSEQRSRRASMPTETAGQQTATYLEAVGPRALDQRDGARPRRLPDRRGRRPVRRRLQGDQGLPGQVRARGGWSTPRSPRPGSPVWPPARRWSGCGRSWSSSSPTSSPARSTRSSTCWPGTTTAPATRCR